MSTAFLLVGPWQYENAREDLDQIAQAIKNSHSAYKQVFTPLDLQIEIPGENSITEVSQERMDHLGLRSWVRELSKRDYIVVTLNNWETVSACKKMVDIARIMGFTIQPISKLITQ
jgi:3-methyladenine DNA glycosylase AlkD